MSNFSIKNEKKLLNKLCQLHDKIFISANSEPKSENLAKFSLPILRPTLHILLILVPNTRYFDTILTAKHTKKFKKPNSDHDYYVARGQNLKI